MKFLIQKVSFVFVLFLFFSSISYSQSRWKIISTTDQFIFYYDSETIKYENNKINLWVKFKFIKPEYDDDGTKIEYEINKWIINCSTKNLAEVDTNVYYKNGKYRNYYGSKVFTEIIPDSIAEDAYNFLCPK